MPRRKLFIAVVLAMVTVVGGGLVGDRPPRVEAACSISAPLVGRVTGTSLGI